MPDFRRWYQPGGTYFFTVVTYHRWHLLSDPAARELLGSIMRKVAHEHYFKTLAIVLLWDHLHCVWNLPTGDADYSTRWNDIKKRFTDRWLRNGGREMPVTPSQRQRRYRGVWQHRFWEHLIRDEEDLETHCDYIHYNPVKHGYVQRPEDWEWSSFRRHAKAGQYDWNWGESEPAHLRKLDYE